MDIVIHAWRVAYVALESFIDFADRWVKRVFSPVPALTLATLSVVVWFLDPRPSWIIFAFMWIVGWAVSAELRAKAAVRSYGFKARRADALHDERVRIEGLLTEATMRAIQNGGLSRREVLELRDRSQFQEFTSVWRIGQ